MAEVQTDVSRQIKPFLLSQTKRRRSVKVRVGSLTTAQMRKISQEGLPGICKNTLIDQSLAGLNWEILSPSGGTDVQTKYYTLLLENANDGEGAATFFTRLSNDVLTTLEGGHFEVVRANNGVPIALYNVDSATIRVNPGDKNHSQQEYPWVQVYNREPEVYFTRDELSHLYWHPNTVFGDTHRNVCPVELAYYYISILAASDDWNFDLLSDPFPAGVFSLPGATPEEVGAFKEAWDYASHGGDLRDIAVIYGVNLGQAQHIKLTRPPTDMAFEITNHWYSSLVAACYEMSILDISILTRVSTKAGAESQERTSAQQGQRKLRKVVDSSIENWILPDGYQFKWIIPKPEDEATQARALESRARAVYMLVQSFGPERGEEKATDMGLLPESSGTMRGVDHLKSTAINADLRGAISLVEWEGILNSLVMYQKEPPTDLWGPELYDWVMAEYETQLFTSLDIWSDQVDDDAEAAALELESRYKTALSRAASRAYLAGKQRDAEDKKDALAIAAIAFTLAELQRIENLIKENNAFFREFTETLTELGQDYEGRASWRLGLYSKVLRRFFLMGVTAMAEAGDMIEIVEGAVQTEHCEECPPRYGTYTVEEYNELGGPPPNWCSGHDACVCGIIVHKGAR